MFVDTASCYSTLLLLPPLDLFCLSKQRIERGAINDETKTINEQTTNADEKTSGGASGVHHEK